VYYYKYYWLQKSYEVKFIVSMEYNKTNWKYESITKDVKIICNRFIHPPILSTQSLRLAIVFSHFPPVCLSHTIYEHI